MLHNFPLSDGEHAVTVLLCNTAMQNLPNRVKICFALPRNPGERWGGSQESVMLMRSTGMARRGQHGKIISSQLERRGLYCETGICEGRGLHFEPSRL